MAITIDGSGTVTGISAGGLPDGSVTPADLSQPLTLATAQASTSGTSIDFTGIPSWVKRVTVMLEGVGTNGTSVPQIQVGAGSVTTSGYLANVAGVAASTSSVQATSGFYLITSTNYNATIPIVGSVAFIKISGNTWIANGIVSRDDATASGFTISGRITLSGTLDRVRITTVNGTDTFDAGSINILYE